MRLRPSGNKGPVATSLASFENYQKTEAWVWEHLALTRGQVVAGPDALAKDVEAMRQEVLALDQDKAKILGDVADMRDRIAAAKAPHGVWDAKIGAGRLQDIELLAQAGALIAGQAARDIPNGLAAAQGAGVISSADQSVLATAYGQCWALQCSTRLLSADPIDSATLGQAGAAFLSRSLGSDSIDALETQMNQTYQAAAQIITRTLRSYGAAKAGSEPEDDG